MIGTYIQLISFSSISIVIPYNFARVLKFFLLVLVMTTFFTPIGQ